MIIAVFLLALAATLLWAAWLAHRVTRAVERAVQEWRI